MSCCGVLTMSSIYDHIGSDVNTPKEKSHQNGKPRTFPPMAEIQPKLVSDAVVEAMRPENIGQRLMLLRMALGFKKSEMADHMGINRVYWYRFESGDRPITNHAAAILYERYGVTLDWLILGRAHTLPVELADRIRAAEQQLQSVGAQAETSEIK